MFLAQMVAKRLPSLHKTRLYCEKTNNCCKGSHISASVVGSLGNKPLLCYVTHKGAILKQYEQLVSYRTTPSVYKHCYMI
jgi:hypothetical protein